NNGHEITCNFVGIAVGVKPNIECVQNTELECDQGILVNDFLETNIEHVYAIGDCAQLRNPILGRKSIETAWYIARAMGKTLAHHICKEATAYQQITWYNSAKFFDIEYQVYGFVPAQIHYPLNSLHLESPNGRQSIRITYDHDTKVVKGFLLMGYRFRQDVCEKWISQKMVLEHVVSTIRMAFFEPEFYKGIARRYMKKFNIEFGKASYLRSRGSFDSVLRFFKRSKKQ
ncbi:MAG: FAD-dependent oxidoreductase, partial [Saprospiraceae bacterium]